ncbi:MAG TPA: ABC transporter permease [Tepidisphaeraceae bacterium]|jgi:ribose/xylose/arabinose/galactoside ABC-type transport system permease subunit
MSTPANAEDIERIKTRRRLPRLGELSLVAIIAALCVLLSFFGWRNAPPGHANLFLNVDNLIDGIATPMSVYAIMAVGATCVIVAAGIDISVGAIFALSALGAAAVLQELPRDSSGWLVIPMAVLIPAFIGTLCGLANGLLVVLLRIHPFIVTLGTMAIFRGVANVTTREKRRPDSLHSLPTVFTDHFMRIRFGDARLMPMLVMLLCVILGAIYLHLTIAGRKNYAIGGNEEAARFSGVRIGPAKLLVYAISGLTAGIAGMVSLGRFATISTNTASGYELMVIAAAVVGGASLMGGRGSAIGALLGTLVIALIQNGIYILQLDEENRSIIIGTAILVAAAMDSWISQRFRKSRHTT